MSGAPPHPGSSWQQCQDQSTGYPYYWNTVTNEVRWDCPLEFQQWTHANNANNSQVSLPPPGIVTNISLATPSTTSSLTSSVQTKTRDTVTEAPKPTSIKSKLVMGYDSDEDNTDDVDNVEINGSIEEEEKKPGFIGPVIPQPESVKSRSNSKEADDILSLIEAENPPDYCEPIHQNQQKLPSSAPKDSAPSKSSSILQLASNYDDDSDTDDVSSKTKPSEINVTKLDNYGRLVFNSDSVEKDESWQTEEQRLALEKYKAENDVELKINKKPDVDSTRNRFDNSIPGSRKRRLDLPMGKFNKSNNLDDIESESDSKQTKLNMVQFVKSSASLPGTINQESDISNQAKNTERELNGADEKSESSKEMPVIEDVESATVELVDKMESFNVGSEKISALKTVAIKLEVLYSAWMNGALSLSYLQTFLLGAIKKLEDAESSLVKPPWTAQWDRLVLF